THTPLRTLRPERSASAVPPPRQRSPGLRGRPVKRGSRGMPAGHGRLRDCTNRIAAPTSSIAHRTAPPGGAPRGRRACACLLECATTRGRLAQLEERFLHTEEVTGSSPVPPTIPGPLASPASVRPYTVRWSARAHVSTDRTMLPAPCEGQTRTAFTAQFPRRRTNMQIQWKLAIATALTAVVAGAASFFAANVAASKGASGTAALKASVGKFHNPDTAFDAGWQPQPGLDQCFELPGTGGMGIHYINTGLMDLTLDPTQPEAIVYQQDPNGRLHLGAVEYIVPQAPWDAAHPLD